MIVLLFIAALAVLILSHEFGHFIFAKWSRMKVEEFGFGFPPRLFSFKKGETIYSVNLIPFGGFVKVLGEDDNEKVPGSFSSKPIYARAAVLAAGVFFNLVLAWFLLGSSYIMGAPSSVGENDIGAVTILDIQSNSQAEKIGLLPGDKIQKLSCGEEVLEISTVKEVQDFIGAHAGDEIGLEYLRGQKLFSATAVPDPLLGIAMDKIGLVSLPIHKAFWESLKDTLFLLVVIVKAFGALFVNLFQGADMAAQIRGPVGIVSMVGTAAEFGFVYVIQFIALLSINLAIINFFPFPALDGGRLLFLGIEAIKRSPVNQRASAVVNTLGFFILIALMLLVTYRDILRLFN